MYTSVQAVLSLYASGKTTGIVLDSGDGVSHAVPVFQGFAIPNSIRRIDVAGRDVTEHLQQLLRKSGRIFHTSAEKETVKHIKETTGYVALDPAKEEKEWSGAARSDGKSVEYTLPDGQKLKVSTEIQNRCTTNLLAQAGADEVADWCREVSGTRNPFQPRDHRARISRSASDCGRSYSPNGHGPSKGSIWQHCALWRFHIDKRIRQQAAS